MSSVGTVAGTGAEGLGVVWLDAHADFDTPEDNLSGFFDVMALAVLTGAGWTALRETVPGFAPVPEEQVRGAGVRDLEPYQRARLGRSAVRAVPERSPPRTSPGARQAAGARGPRVPPRRPRRARQPRGPGQRVRRARRARARRRGRSRRRGVRSLHGRRRRPTAYDPAEDANGRAREVGRRVIARIRERARG